MLHDDINKIILNRHSNKDIYTSSLLNPHLLILIIELLIRVSSAGFVTRMMMASLIGAVNLNNTDSSPSALALIMRENRKNNFTRLICTSK